MAPTLAAGGVVVFPHAGVLDCGHQVAASVHGCLDSGADRVVVISVLHAFTDEMQDARQRVSAGEDPSAWPFWGIQGPGIDGREEWAADHSLISFRHFWEAETKRRGIAGPEVVERYPYLAGGRPDRLPGIDELAALPEDAVVVSTADPFHHGIGYGDPPERALDPHEGGLDLARATIEEGIDLLGRGDYAAYDAHCLEAEERRARCRRRLPLPPWGASRRDRRPDVHRRGGALRGPGPDMGSCPARRVATVDRLRREWLDRPAPARRFRGTTGEVGMRRTTAPRGLAIGVTAVAVFWRSSDAAWAAQPDKAPFTPDPIVLEPGQACAFPVEIAPVYRQPH